MREYTTTNTLRSLYKCRYVTQDGFCIVNNYTKCVIQSCDITDDPSHICNDYDDMEVTDNLLT